MADEITKRKAIKSMEDMANQEGGVDDFIRAASRAASNAASSAASAASDIANTFNDNKPRPSDTIVYPPGEEERRARAKAILQKNEANTRYYNNPEDDWDLEQAKKRKAEREWKAAQESFEKSQREAPYFKALADEFKEPAPSKVPKIRKLIKGNNG